MNNHEGCIRGYYRPNKAHYAKQLKDQEISVYFGMYHPEGGTSGELSVEWKELDQKLVPQLKAFDDSWSALSLFTDLIKILGEVDNKYITDDEFCEILNSLGFYDMTRYDPPYKNELEKEKFRGSEGVWWLSGNDIMCNIHTKIGKVFPTNINDTKEHKYNRNVMVKSPEMLKLLQSIVYEFSEYKIHAQGTDKCQIILKAEELIKDILTIE